MKLLTGNGSDRRFYRAGAGLIYIEYRIGKEEDNYYSSIASFLKRLNINVPQVHCVGKQSVLVTDLGDTHLCDMPEPEYYYKVIDQLVKLHCFGKEEYMRQPFDVSPPFDYSMYIWESGYFAENLGLRSDKDADAAFRFMAGVLSKEEKMLIHRDCQSKNIMIMGGDPYFIDFQGMRFGLPWYDLASLLEDPYVCLSDGLKRRLRDYYVQEAVKAGGAVLNAERDDTDRIYRYCAVQRLMQAVGAFAFLGNKKGKKDFLRYIPRGLERLKNMLERDSALNGILRILPQDRQTDL